MITLVGGQLILERVLNMAGTLSVVIEFVGGALFIYLLIKGSRVIEINDVNKNTNRQRYSMKSMSAFLLVVLPQSLGQTVQESLRYYRL